MKLFIVFVFTFYSAITSARSIRKEQAHGFLKDVNCDFSAYMISNKGRVASIAICAQSMQEQNALKSKVCVIRGADMLNGVYTSEPQRGDVRRVEGSYCNRESIIKILNSGYYRNELRALTQLMNGTWHVVDDDYGVFEDFKTVANR